MIRRRCDKCGVLYNAGYQHDHVCVKPVKKPARKPQTTKQPK